MKFIFCFFVPSTDELARSSDKTVHKAKPTDIREQLQDIIREIIYWTRFWHVILAFYKRNMFSSKKVVSEEKKALMIVAKKVTWRRARFSADFKLTEGFIVLFLWNGK